MRITIENTVYEPEYAKKLIIELPADDISLPEMFRIYADALDGFGYAGARKYLEGEDE